MSFKDKVVIITGASSGIGAAAAVAFSAEGAKVVMVARDEIRLAAVEKKCQDPLVIRADVSNDEDSRRIIQETIKKYGQIDILINNAGAANGLCGLLQEGIMKSYDKIMNTNLRAVVHLTSLAGPYLIKTKGNVINISSISGKNPTVIPGFINYHISKAGLDHFTRCAAVELAVHGVRVNTVSPGPVRTDFMKVAGNSVANIDVENFTLLKRISEPEEISDLILFLASDKAKGITGSDFVSDNGALVKRT